MSYPATCFLETTFSNARNVCYGYWRRIRFSVNLSNRICLDRNDIISALLERRSSGDYRTNMDGMKRIKQWDSIFVTTFRPIWSTMPCTSILLDHTHNATD